MTTTQAVAVFCFRCQEQGLKVILYEHVGPDIRIRVKGRLYTVPNSGGLAKCAHGHVTAISCAALTT